MTTKHVSQIKYFFVQLFVEGRFTYSGMIAPKEKLDVHLKQKSHFNFSNFVFEEDKNVSLYEEKFNQRSQILEAIFY